MFDTHDLGGSTAFGPIPDIDKEYEYNERWEYTLMGLTRMASKNKLFLTDALRHSIERLPREYYLNSVYYNRYITGLTRAHIEAGLISVDDLKKHAPDHVVFPEVIPMGPGHASTQPAQVQRFTVGDRVQVRSPLPDGHVRAPAYVRGKVGTILRCGYVLPFPGQAGHREAAVPEQTYLVEFDRAALWSDTPDEGTVTVDLWDSYLEPAASNP